MCVSTYLLLSYPIYLPPLIYLGRGGRGVFRSTGVRGSCGDENTGHHPRGTQPSSFQGNLPLSLLLCLSLSLSVCLWGQAQTETDSCHTLSIYLCIRSDPQQKALLRRVPCVTLHSNLIDSNLYLFSHWVLELIAVKEDFIR